MRILNNNNFLPKKLVPIIIIFSIIIFTFGIFSNTIEAKAITTMELTSKSQMPILIYHHFDPDISKCDGLTITPDRFYEDMLYLKLLGYNTISFEELVASTDDKFKLPQNPVLITIDDGYFSNYQYAYPILKELNMKATIFIIGWSVGRELHKDNSTKILPHFSWSQAMEMQASGLINIQPHTFDMHDNGSNPLYPRNGVSRLQSENDDQYKSVLKTDISKITSAIKSNIGNDPLVFSYPYGLYTAFSEEIIKDMGYKVSLGTAEGVNDLSNGLYKMKRIQTPYSLKSSLLMAKILKFQNKNVKIPFADISDSKARIIELKKALNIQ